MSKAGQSTFTGISDQADIALFYLLQANKKSDFQKILIEGAEYEDFTLVYACYCVDYEVKSHQRQLTFNDIQKIVGKKLNKQYGEKDKFKIIVRKLSRKFRDCYEYVHDYIHWIETKGFKKDSTAKEFLDKGWLESEISFLARVEIVEFSKVKNIQQQISEYFAYEYPFYLDSLDQRNIIAQFFKEILGKGKSGGMITCKDFRDKLVSFERHIADCPTKFDPKLSIGTRLLNIKDFLSTSEKLKELNHKTYLGQLTAHPRLIFYLCDELEKGDFHVDDFGFFIDKILLKQHYVRLVLRILEKKWMQNKVSPWYLIDFVINNYKKLSYDFNYDEALRILKNIAQKDTEGKFEQKIMAFLRKEILQPFSKERKRRFQRSRRGWREDERVAEILKIFLERTKNKKDFVNFIFGYFDFTSDDFENVIETHPLIYSFVKDFIKENLEKNFDYVIKKISEQFNIQYNGKYKGYEWIGSGISQAGSSYSIADKGVVRLLFTPLFTELYQSDAKKAWKFFKDRILNKAKTRATKDTPIYLKRSLIAIVLDRIEKKYLTDTEKKKTFEYLKNILRMKKGIPGTSEIIFDRISRRNLQKIGYDRIMVLIEIDVMKYKRKDYSAGYPTNLFVISTLIKLIKEGHKPAKDFYIALIKKSDFIKRDRHYDSFEQMVAQGIPESDPDFIVQIFNCIDFETYLDSFDKDIVWDKSGLISGLIKKDWQDNTSRGQQIVTRLLKNKIPSKKVLEFLAGPIRDLAQHDAVKAYNLLYPYLQNKDIFWQTFQNNSYARESIVSMAEDLVKIKKYKEAEHIIDLCIDDPDPDTDEKSEFNYHLKIKNGEEESLITSVRGKLAWAIQKFVISNDPKLMEYALKKTKILLDLDGALAKKLNYSEPDLYVRQEALVPFIELSHPGRRKLLCKDLSDSIKTTAFDILRSIDKQIKSGEAKPVSLIGHLLHVFSYIRNVSTDEAKEILTFFEYHKISKAHFLFVYFAIYRKDQYKQIPFDSKYFENKLVQLCQENKDFRQSLAWDFWRTAEEDKEKKTNLFDNIEKYWKLLFTKYDQQTFDDLYRTLEITLTNSAKYIEHKGLFKKALKMEIEYLRTHKIQAQLWEPGKEIFQILKERSDDDFLDVFSHLIENLNENIYYFWIKDWIAMFKSIEPTSEEKKALCAKIRSRLKELLPEYLEDK